MKLNEKNDKLTKKNELEQPSTTNANTAGATTIINALRRPSASEIMPLKTAPNGWPINVKLAGN